MCQFKKKCKENHLQVRVSITDQQPFLILPPHQSLLHTPLAYALLLPISPHMKIFKDFLEWYNDLNVQPFIEAVEKIKHFIKLRN